MVSMATNSELPVGPVPMTDGYSDLRAGAGPGCHRYSM
jgi:hypothetical protein